MRRAASSAKKPSNNYDVHTSNRKPPNITDRLRKSPTSKENTNLSRKSASKGHRAINGSGFSSPKDSFGDLTNLSFEASISQNSLKNYDTKLKNGNTSFSKF